MKQQVRELSTSYESPPLWKPHLPGLCPGTPRCARASLKAQLRSAPPAPTVCVGGKVVCDHYVFFTRSNGNYSQR
jgi:hypothetical protein